MCYASCVAVSAARLSLFVCVCVYITRALAMKVN